MQNMALRLTKSNHSLNRDASGAFMGFDDTSLEHSDENNSDVEKGDCVKSLDEVYEN